MLPKKATKRSGLIVLNKKKSSSSKNIVKELPKEPSWSSESGVEEHEDEEEDDQDPDDDEDKDGEDEDKEEEEDIEPQTEGEEEDIETIGFGDAMSKILQQNVADDALPILAKRTTARMRAILTEKKETKTAKLSASERRQREQKDMIIPDHTTLVKDRQLRMIATKGVVALFNAIEKHQYQSGKHSGTTGDKKVQVKALSKESFLGLLKGATTSSTTTPVSITTSKEAPSTETSGWSVTKDDFMMGAKLKDWDATNDQAGGEKDDNDDAEAAWNQAADFDSEEEEEESKETNKKRARNTSLKDKKTTSTKKKLKN